MFCPCVYTLFHHIQCSVGCGPPPPPPRGSLGDLTSSQDGAVVAFQCNPGLAPSQQMMSVCAANGSWTPDPAELVCMLPPPGILNAVCRVRLCCFVPVSKYLASFTDCIGEGKAKIVLTPCTHLLINCVCR